MISNNQNKICVAILFALPRTNQNFRRLGIAELSARFDVKLYDLTSMLGRGEISINGSLFNGVQFINSFDSLVINLTNDKPSYILNTIGLDFLTEDILVAIQNCGSTHISMISGVFPKFTIISRVRWHFHKFLMITKGKKDVIESSSTSNNKNIKKTILLSSIIRRLMRNYQKIDKSAKYTQGILLLAGRRNFHKHTQKYKKILSVASNDFYLFHEARKKYSENKLNFDSAGFILFVDDNLPNASDWQVLNMRSPVNEKNYYASLTYFFSQVETYFNLPIKIAAHPSSINDSEISKKFGNRPVIHEQTALLTIQSTLILAHASTAISFSVLAKKPIFFVTSDELEQSFYGMYIRSCASYLGSKLISIDKPINRKFHLEKLEVNGKKYTKYEQDFIRSFDCQENYPWEALINYIKTN